MVEMSKRKQTTIKRLLEHYRDLIYYEEWFWGCEHKDYTDQEVLEWIIKINKKEGKMKEHKNYESGQGCEFRADGKLRGGVVLEDLGAEFLLGYHGPEYMQIILDKNAVKFH